MIKLSKIKGNPSNPRIIKDEKFRKLCNSIESFPKMMELRPIVVDANFVVQGGNMRLKALQHLGYSEVADNWVKMAEDFTEEELKEFVIKDNVGFGEWDWNELANAWDEINLAEWGLGIPEMKVIGEDELEDLSDKIKSDFRIEIICKDEKDQELTYNKLIEQNLECRLLTL